MENQYINNQNSMKKIILPFIVFAIFIGCKPAQLIICKYSGHNRSSFGHYLTLNSDNTFEYEIMRGWAYKQVLVSGTWKEENNKLLIDSRDSLMQNFLPLSIKELMITDQDSLKFILCIPSDYLYVNWRLIIDDNSYSFINDSVVSIINTSSEKQFYLAAERDMLIVPRINRETIRTQTQTLQDRHSNLVELSISLTIAEVNRYANYELLNDTLTIKKNKLVWSRKNIELKPHNKEGY